MKRGHVQMRANFARATAEALGLDYEALRRRAVAMAPPCWCSVLVLSMAILVVRPCRRRAASEAADESWTTRVIDLPRWLSTHFTEEDTIVVKMNGRSARNRKVLSALLDTKGTGDRSLARLIDVLAWRCDEGPCEELMDRLYVAGVAVRAWHLSSDSFSIPSEHMPLDPRGGRHLHRFAAQAHRNSSSSTSSSSTMTTTPTRRRRVPAHRRLLPTRPRRRSRGRAPYYRRLTASPTTSRWCRRAISRRDLPARSRSRPTTSWRLNDVLSAQAFAMRERMLRRLYKRVGEECAARIFAGANSGRSRQIRDLAQIPACCRPKTRRDGDNRPRPQSRPARRASIPGATSIVGTRRRRRELRSRRPRVPDRQGAGPPLCTGGW